MTKVITSQRIAWSSLTESFSIPASMQSTFYTALGCEILQDSLEEIEIIIGSKRFKLNVYNSPTRLHGNRQAADYVRLFYHDNKSLVNSLIALFEKEYGLLKKQKKSPKENKANLLEIQTEIVLYATDEKGVFEFKRFDPLPNDDEIYSNITEDMFESNLDLIIDQGADIVKKEKLISIRKLDKSICDNLKEYYDFTCQMTGERIGIQYGKEIVEAHHIDYFTKSKNNNSDNIIILSPNYHRIIHATNPIFNRDRLQFEFQNGLIEKVKINKHL